MDWISVLARPAPSEKDSAVKRVHIAIGTSDVEATIQDYTRRVGAAPCVVVPGEYAMWRTDILNLAIRKVTGAAGTVRHIGFEEDGVEGFVETKDVNGITWECFSPQEQDRMILDLWPDAIFQ